MLRLCLFIKNINETSRKIYGRPTHGSVREFKNCWVLIKIHLMKFQKMSNKRNKKNKSPFAEDNRTDGFSLSSFVTLGLPTINIKSLLFKLDICVSHYERGSVRMDAIAASVMGEKLLSAKLSKGKVTKITNDPILWEMAAAKPFLVIFVSELSCLLSIQISRAEELKSSVLVLLSAIDGALA